MKMQLQSAKEKITRLEAELTIARQTRYAPTTTTPYCNCYYCNYYCNYYLSAAAATTTTTATIL
jgi:hypothetical protein